MDNDELLLLSSDLSLNSPCITTNYNFANQQYYVSEKKFLMSDNI